MTTTQALPKWDLNDLYAGVEAPEIELDLKDAEARARAFQAAYQGRLVGLDGAGLAAAIVEYEGLLEIVYRIMSFAQLLHATHTTDAEVGRFYQTLQERVNAITTETLFFTLELNAVDDDVLAAQLDDPVATRYAPWIQDSRAMRPHQLDEAQERLLHEKDVAGRSAWVRLFDETLAHLKFDLDGQEKPLTDTLNQLSDSDADKRKAAGRALANGLHSSERLCG